MDSDPCDWGLIDVFVRNKIGEDKGVITIVVTAAMAALLLSLAVVIDIGLLYQERRQLQTSTDAAALAAAMDIAEGQSVHEAVFKAVEYVSSNSNVPPSQIQISFPQNNEVRVTAKTYREVYFSGLVGKRTAQVTAKSTAMMGAASGVSKLVPFIVPLEKVPDYTGESKTGTFELGEDRPTDQSNKAQMGYFWLCNFDNGSGGVPDYDRWIRNGFPEYVYVGDMANGVGVKASLKDALLWRKGNDPEIVLPVYSDTSRGGSVGKYHVVGFAEFVITGFDFTGQPKTISGYFTGGTTVSGVPGSKPNAYFGIDTIWLVD